MSEAGPPPPGVGPPAPAAAEAGFRAPAAGSSAPATAEAVIHSRAAALGLLALLTLIWGVHWVVVKTGLQYMPPLTYASLRVGSGLVTMVALLTVTGRLRRPDPANLPIMLSVGLGQIGAGVALQVLALQAVSAGRSSVLLYTMPLWVAALLAIVFRIRPRRNELLGLVLGIGGLAALLNPAVIDWQSVAELLGTFGLLLNAVIWAAVTIHVRRHRWTQSPLELQPWMLLIALVPLVVLALALEPGRAIRWEPITIGILLYSGPLATAFAYWASQAITRTLGAQASGTGFLATPVVGLASGALLLNESLGVADLIGFTLILAGIAVTSLVPSAGPMPAVASQPADPEAQRSPR